MAKAGQEIQAELRTLDPLLEHRLRLGACVLLSSANAMTFTRLRDLLEATDGNLGAQLRKLEEAGYLRAHKEFVNRKPQTWYSLSASGRRALLCHLDSMQNLLQSAGVHITGHGSPGGPG